MYKNVQISECFLSPDHADNQIQIKKKKALLASQTLTILPCMLLFTWYDSIKQYL